MSHLDGRRLAGVRQPVTKVNLLPPELPEEHVKTILLQACREGRSIRALVSQTQQLTRLAAAPAAQLACKLLASALEDLRDQLPQH